MKTETIVAISCITLLEAIALLKGIDGTYLSIVIAVIAGLGGYGVAKVSDVLTQLKVLKDLQNAKEKK